MSSEIEAAGVPKPPGMLRTHGGLAVVTLISCAVVALLYLVLWQSYDVGKPRSIGFHSAIAEFIAATYAPLLIVSFSGYRNAAFTLFQDPSKNVPLSSAPFFYLISLSGVGGALLCLAYIGTGLEIDTAKKLVGFSAAYWGATVGWIFDKLYKNLAN